MNKQKFSISFLDINTFASEEFTSGLLITVREILRRFEKFGVKTSILSIAEATRTKEWQKYRKYGRRERSVQGLRVDEILLKSPPDQHPELYIDSIEMLLNFNKPDIILMNTAAVFLEDFHLYSLKKALANSKKVVVLLVDALFPTYKNAPKKKVDEYYSLLKKTEVISSSKEIIDIFFKETGIKAKQFQNLFNINDVVASKHEYKYVTLINHHPIKGREIFDCIAKKLPQDKFLIVQTWPDVPAYVIHSNNVTFLPFNQDVRRLYSQIKILLVPSLCKEGPARVIIEAMLNGIPVIAHRIGSIPEIGDGHILLVDPPDISNTKLVGTILIPQLKNEDLIRVPNDFISMIKNIEMNQKVWKNYSREAKKFAQQYCNTSEKIFEKYISELLLHIQS